MSISILAPFPPTFGPGLRINLQSSVISSGASDVTWTVDVFGGAEERNVLHQVLIGQSNVVDGQLGLQPQGGFRIPDVGLQPGTGITVQLHAEASSTGEIDTGTSSDFVWEPVLNAWALTSQVATTGGQAGFTDTDRQLLVDSERRSRAIGEPTDVLVTHPSGPTQTTIGRILSRFGLDTLGVHELTNGPTCEPVRVALSEFYTAVIVRVTTIAPDLVPRTPDQEWYFPDLAVLRVFRGQDLQYRRGIHTPTFMVEHPWEWGWALMNIPEIGGVPPETSIAVDWRLGCCGQVLLLSSA